MLSSVSFRSAERLRPVFGCSLMKRRTNLKFRWFSSAACAVEDDYDTPSSMEPEEVVQTKRESDLRPSEIVNELDRHIVGQQDAKRAVAIALRNRWRRKQLPEDLRKEIMPRNVLLVGPTGCGKTEVARRMAKLNDAPFLKVEATKFTEVGYHGRDVDKIICDLMDASMQLSRKKYTEQFKEQAEEIVEDRILYLLTGTLSGKTSTRPGASLRAMLKDGLLDDHEIEVDVRQSNNNNRNNDLAAVSSQTIMKKPTVERRKMPISKARSVILEAEIEKLLNTVDIQKEALAAVEENGIVFIDEIDKIASANDSFGPRSADASAEGVQRDLLPLVEGSTISTKFGNVNTDYILFVASGAFHAVKPSDLLPELQGRFPVRVQLKGLTEQDMYKILTEPVANLVRQQVELVRTEGVELSFEDDAIREIARMAFLLNKEVENIGARRLHTVMERIVEELSFHASEMEPGTKLIVNKELVEQRLKDAIAQPDMTKFIL